MVKNRIKYFFTVTICFSFLSTFSQSNVNVSVDIDTKHQEIEGFGAALAYYENWLTAHPNKKEVYGAIFNELSLDILRVRNAYDYDSTMIDRVVEFYNEANKALGHKIKILSSSWGATCIFKIEQRQKKRWYVKIFHQCG